MASLAMQVLYVIADSARGLGGVGHHEAPPAHQVPGGALRAPNGYAAAGSGAGQEKPERTKRLVVSLTKISFYQNRPKSVLN